MLAYKDDDELRHLQEVILKTVEQLESVQFYKQVAAQMETHAGIRKLIRQKKRIQKELVNAEHVKKAGQVALLSHQLKTVEASLLAIPLYQQYLTAIEEAQEDLDIISECIAKAFAVSERDRYDDNEK